MGNTKTHNFLDMFKGVTGGYDTARILFAIGGINGVISPIVFQAIAFSKGQPWDAVGFCAGYGGMLAAVLAAGGVGIRQKDKGVADAQSTMSANDVSPTSPPS